jgi:Flp pilus assembly CpaF family ATPase
MSESSQNSESASPLPLADQGREPHPQLVAGRAGTRLYSLAALQERIEMAFAEEYPPESEVLHEANTAGKQLKLILETANYVLGVESVALDAEAKAAMIERIHANLFGYGVLNPLLVDERVTTIAIHGAAHVSVRYGHGELVEAPHVFDDEEHLKRIVQRLLMDASAVLRDDEPIVETGLMLGARPASLSVVAPPISAYMYVDLRLHAQHAPTLDEMIAQGWLTEEAAALLRQIVQSQYGFMVVGDTESGKTTFLNALLSLLPGEGMLAVERSGELRLPVGADRMLPQWGQTDETSVTFGQLIERGLAEQPSLLVLDEIRADEPLMILPLLSHPETPRQVWSVRGVTDAKRLQSSLGMLARRANMARSEEMVAKLYERLPFIVTVRKIQNSLKVFSIAEWQSRVDSDYPDYVMLMQYQNGAARPTGSQLARWLD